MTELPVKPPVQVTFPVQPVAVSNVLVPKQIEALLLDTVGVTGLAKTLIVTATLESLLQPLMVQSTRYVLVLVGFTVILPPVSPSVHERAPLVQADAVRVTDSPGQILVLLATIVGVEGFARTETVTAILESPLQAFTVQSAL